MIGFKAAIVFITLDVLAHKTNSRSIGEGGNKNLRVSLLFTATNLNRLVISYNTGSVPCSSKL